MVIVLMGVTGSGKSTVGRLLAERLGWSFFEGDDFHPPENVRKMAAGEPLTDDDRRPWLAALAEVIAELVATGGQGVVACSALRAAYRRALAVGPEVRFVHLAVEESESRRRLQQRTDHYMPAGLVASQFAALEEPGEALRLDGTLPAEHLVDEIVQILMPRAGGSLR